MPLFTKAVSNKKSDGDSAKSLFMEAAFINSFENKSGMLWTNEVSKDVLSILVTHLFLPFWEILGMLGTLRLLMTTLVSYRACEIEVEFNITSALGKWVILLINALTFVSPSCSFPHHFITRLIWNSCETNTIFSWREENKTAYLTWLYNTLLRMPKMRSFWLIYLSDVQL